MEVDLDDIFGCAVRTSYVILTHHDRAYAEVDLMDCTLWSIDKQYINLIHNLVEQIEKSTTYRGEVRYFKGSTGYNHISLSFTASNPSVEINQDLLGDVLENEWHHVKTFNMQRLIGKTFDDAIINEDEEVSLFNEFSRIIYTYYGVGKTDSKYLRKMKKHWNTYF